MSPAVADLRFSITVAEILRVAKTVMQMGAPFATFLVEAPVDSYWE
jgi:hypothetical protein